MHGQHLCRACDCMRTVRDLFPEDTAPVVEKAQQDPQKAWFLTGVTAPFSTQFTLFAGLTFL